MSADRIFVDTNILVYAHDIDSGDKHRRAVEQLAGLWEGSVLPSVSIQVLQEFYVTLIKKNISAKLAKEYTEDYLVWNVIDNDRRLLMQGIALKERWKISFWDALILAAAERAGASIVWSEDLSSGQRYDEITVMNPLVGGTNIKN